MTGPEDIAHQAVAAPGMQLGTVGRTNTGGILTAVLEYSKRVVNCLVDRPFSDQSCYSTHVSATRRRIDLRLCLRLVRQILHHFLRQHTTNPVGDLGAVGDHF